MPWFNIGGASAVQATGIAETPYTVSGIPGYATQAQAQAHPLNTEQAARLAAVDPAAVATGAGKAVASKITSVDQFVQALGSASLWIRVAETALGILLIIAGVAKLTDAIPAATTIARTLR
jgi:hypothetical protein